MPDPTSPAHNNQLSLDNPVDRYPKISPPKQDQPEPGLDAKLEPQADHGEQSYVGTGRLKGRKALITGGDSGIGAAVAIAFAREGADVAIAYLPAEEEDAQKIISVIQQEGRTAVALPGDLLESNYRNELVDQAAKELGGLDILVNNAGKQIAVEQIEDLSDEQVLETFQVNILAMFTLSKAALKYLPEGASIINTTSVQAYEPSPVLLDYASTKAAINAFTKGLATQLAPRGIRVNAVAPGPIWTPLQVSDGQPKDKLPKFGHNVPLGRAGQPVELAAAYVFLASPESSYVVGETLNVNGGRSTP
ncbi:SDR family oxidoreductase [Glutamicibacter uratoxydans]|uniref:SDR family oxidoreductase n=1 Tax=Glutamicibacter uratoxydans TaxID=43667 RepID=UPI003D6F9778